MKKNHIKGLHIYSFSWDFVFFSYDFIIIIIIVVVFESVGQRFRLWDGSSRQLFPTNNKRGSTQTGITENIYTSAGHYVALYKGVQPKIISKKIYNKQPKVCFLHAFCLMSCKKNAKKTSLESGKSSAWTDNHRTPSFKISKAFTGSKICWIPNRWHRTRSNIPIQYPPKAHWPLRRENSTRNCSEIVCWCTKHIWWFSTKIAQSGQTYVTGQ